MTITDTAKHLWINVGSVAIICGFISYVVVFQWEHDALAQTVNNDRCQAARTELAQYNFMLKQSRSQPTPETLAEMARLQQIIDESCAR
jgi:hypothetical protein